MSKKQWISIGVALGLFACLALLTQLEKTTAVEGWIYRVVAGVMSPPLTAFMRFASFLCDPPTLVVVCLALLLVPVLRNSGGLTAVSAAVVAVGFNTVLKRLFSRQRPDILWLVEESGFSFPSSHSITSAAIGTALALLAAEKASTPRRRRLLQAAGVLYPLLVGVSRVYLGVHHAGDVLGGWMLGYVVGTAVHAAGKRWFYVAEKK